MTNLKSRLKEELKQTMLAREVLKTSVLRMLKSAITYYEIQKGGAGYEATDEDVISVISKEAKQRKDSIEQFTNAKRLDLVDKEKKELEMLQVYLPQQMGEEEIKKLVIEVIKKTDAKGIQKMGKVMGALMQKVKGRADGGLVSKIVKESLS